MTPITCACQHCIEMCRHTTCLPTPEEVKVLIARGYGDRLSRYEWKGVPHATGPSPKGREGKTLTTTQSGQCTFHQDDGRCELHDLGLKPLEGRLAHHDRHWMPVRAEILKYWDGISP